jgi:hypothetical protein
MHLEDGRLQDCMADLRRRFKALVVMMGLRNEYFPDHPWGQQFHSFLIDAL